MNVVLITDGEEGHKQNRYVGRQKLAEDYTTDITMQTNMKQCNKRLFVTTAHIWSVRIELIVRRCNLKGELIS